MYRRVHCSIFDTLVYPTGLSLCVQGTFFIGWNSYLRLRFIPVCTGNIKAFLVRVTLITVYPCVYREHNAVNVSIGVTGGLSLCVQGTYINLDSLNGSKRFIPVCTGNIDRPAKLQRLSSVYPCVYREHHRAVSLKNGLFGLSLCVQGTYDIPTATITRKRFIPVCTGNINVSI